MWRFSNRSDFIVHDLLVAKLQTYGFTYEAFNVTKNYLSERTHRTKMNDFYGSLLDLLIGVPQGSPLGGLLKKYLLLRPILLQKGRNRALIC